MANHKNVVTVHVLDILRAQEVLGGRDPSNWGKDAWKAFLAEAGDAVKMNCKTDAPWTERSSALLQALVAAGVFSTPEALAWDKVAEEEQKKAAEERERQLKAAKAIRDGHSEALAFIPECQRQAKKDYPWVHVWGATVAAAQEFLSRRHPPLGMTEIKETLSQAIETDVIIAKRAASKTQSGWREMQWSKLKVFCVEVGLAQPKSKDQALHMLEKAGFLREEPSPLEKTKKAGEEFFRDHLSGAVLEGALRQLGQMTDVEEIENWVAKTVDQNTKAPEEPKEEEMEEQDITKEKVAEAIEAIMAELPKPEVVEPEAAEEKVAVEVEVEAGGGEEVVEEDSFDDVLRKMAEANLQRQFLVELALLMGRGHKAEILAFANGERKGLAPSVLRAVTNRLDQEAIIRLSAAAEQRRNAEEEAVAREAAEKAAQEAEAERIRASKAKKAEKAEEEAKAEEAEAPAGEPKAEEKKAEGFWARQRAKAAEKKAAKAAKKAAKAEKKDSETPNEGAEEEKVKENEKAAKAEKKGRLSRFLAALVAMSERGLGRIGLGKEARSLRNWTKKVRKEVKKAIETGVVVRTDGDKDIQDLLLDLFGGIAAVNGKWEEARKGGRAESQKLRSREVVIREALRASLYAEAGEATFEAFALEAVLVAISENAEAVFKNTKFTRGEQKEAGLPMSNHAHFGAIFALVADESTKARESYTAAQKKAMEAHEKALGSTGIWARMKELAGSFFWKATFVTAVLVFAIGDNIRRNKFAWAMGAAGAVVGATVAGALGTGVLLGTAAAAVGAAVGVFAAKAAKKGLSALKGWWTNRKAKKAAKAAEKAGVNSTIQEDVIDAEWTEEGATAAA